MTEKLDKARELCSSYREGRFEEVFDLNYIKIKGTIVKDNSAIENANELIMGYIMKHTVDSLYKFYKKFAEERGPNCFVDGKEFL